MGPQFIRASKLKRHSTFKNAAEFGWEALQLVRKCVEIVVALVAGQALEVHFR